MNHEVWLIPLISLWYRKIVPQINFNVADKNSRCFTVAFVHSIKAHVRQHTSQLETL